MCMRILDVVRPGQHGALTVREVPDPVPRGDEVVVAVANLSGVWQHGYRIGLAVDGPWQVVLSTADARFGGHGHGPTGAVAVEPEPCQDRPASTVLDLPPRTVLYLAPGDPGSAG